MYARHPELAEEFERATPKGAKLPERLHKKRLKKAYVNGAGDAMAHFGLKTASAEVRLKIPRPTESKFHGFEAVWREMAKKNASDEMSDPLGPQATPDTGAEQLATAFQQLDDKPGSRRDNAAVNRLDRTPAWSAPSHLGAGNATTVDYGMPTDIGRVF